MIAHRYAARSGQSGQRAARWRRAGRRLAAAALLALGAAGLATALAGQRQAGSHPAAAAVHEPARRIITLAPHLTELVFAAGAGDRIVGTVVSSNYPAGALLIPRVGNGLNVNAEQIIALKPDLVLAWQPSGAARTLAPTLAALHIPLAYMAPRQLDDIPQEIEALGGMLGTADTARREAALLRRRIAALAARYAQRRAVTVLIEVGTAPLYTIGRDPLINDALRLCGGVNAYAHAQLAAPQISAEDVLLAQPEAVITPSTGPDRLAARVEYWSRLRLRAALRRHVYAIDPDELFRPGPRFIGATEKLCRDLDKAR